MNDRIEIRQGRILNVKRVLNPSSNTTIFLIHGLGGRSAQWREQIKLLSEKFNLVMPDLLGHGESDKPVSYFSNLYSFAEFEQDLMCLFQRFASHKNMLIGHSYGGALATSLAIHYQANVNKLILISPVPCVPSVTIPFIYHLPAFILERIRSTLEKQFLNLAFDTHTNPSIIEEEAMASRANPMSIIKSTIKGMKNMPLLDVSKLTIPTLIILGEHDRLIPPAMSQQFYKNLPNHHFETILRAGHMEMLEQSKQINQLMMTFLTQ